MKCVRICLIQKVIDWPHCTLAYQLTRTTRHSVGKRNLQSFYKLRKKKGIFCVRNPKWENAPLSCDSGLWKHTCASNVVTHNIPITHERLPSQSKCTLSKCKWPPGPLYSTWHRTQRGWMIKLTIVTPAVMVPGGKRTWEGSARVASVLSQS